MTGSHETENLSNEPSKLDLTPVPRRGVDVGTVLGRILLVERIGQGSSGVVFRALHKTLNVPVAVKLIQSHDIESDRLTFEKLRHEAHLLAQINHPHVIRVWDFEDNPDRPYLVLEHVEGLSLAELIQQSGRLCLDRVLGLMSQVVEALSALWQLGYVHRDVKPGNILVAKDGRAKLADLGLARAVAGRSGASAEEQAESMEGTVAYMAPEQAAAPATVDHRADIYALGATFYHALTGQLPFNGRTRMEVMVKHARAPLVPPHEVVSELNGDTSALFVKLMAKNPKDRYQDPGSLLADVARLHKKASPSGDPDAAADAAGLTLSSTSGGQARLWKFVQSSLGRRR